MNRRVVLVIPSCLLLAVAVSRTQTSPPAQRWYKGNLHTHTLNSDGDATPLEVATWYREHGYQFLVLSDHNYLTDPSGLNSVLGAKEQFLLFAGEEVTDSFEGKPIHVNAYNLREFVAPQHGPGIVATIENNINAIRKVGALPSLNHPNFRWAVSKEEMLAVRGMTHFEVYNGHAQVNNRGGGGSASLEEMWDALLTAGRHVYGIAVDDAHNYHAWGAQYQNPGRGWVTVRASSLSGDAIVEALQQGEFYSSTGVRLRDLRVTQRDYSLEIEPIGDERYTTYFIGAGGKVLATGIDAKPRYPFLGTEQYVRARIESSNGTMAWTQPVLVSGDRRAD